MTRTTLFGRVAAALLVSAIPCAGLHAQAADPLASLSPDKRAFLSDAATLEKLGLTPEKVQIALAGRTPQQVDAYAAALMQLLEDAKFKPGRDAGEIALNPQARGFNSGTIVRPKILDKVKRDDGPFSLKRYMYQKAGVPTFADAPVAIRLEDLTAGKVDVAFVGVPLDFSSGWRDAKHAPEALRGMDGLVGADADGGVDPGLVLNLADYGNLTIDPMAPDRGLDHVRSMLADVAKAGVVPFVVGGDHTLMYPDVAAMVDAYGAGNVAVVQFDAHADAEENGDHLISDNQTLTRLLAENIVRPANVTHVGLRGRGATGAVKARLAAAGVKLVPMQAISEKGAVAATDAIVAGLRGGPANVFVSFDMSVLDPGDAPASGRPVPGGITMREAIPMVRRICSETKVVGFDLLDTAPILDPTYLTRLSANYILHACLSGIALRKAAATQTAAAR
ncbi:agmatinase [Sphingomonas spermidinifaciens]|uniref:Agmatinase n=1 Tax=Sphingomonas spermidinifaciens TaxID=1141889 RepID=A0A2A4B2B3_9SPHN|nr:agmatinase family protein [Sphingomonas spermidinifaciens]PCD02105.1 agmatinase [Sphingomonas spermidinifaciens]